MILSRVESEGSFWYIGEGVYYRTPKGEGPREPGDWDDPEPGNPLRDLEQHYMEEWCIIPEWTDTHTNRFPGWASARAIRYAPNQFPILCIHVGSGVVVSAPGVV